MNRPPHIIQQLNLHLEVNHPGLAVTVPDEVVRRLKNDILPQLERWLDSLDTSDQMLQIESLSVNLGMFSPQDISSQLPVLAQKAVLEALAQQLQEMDESGTGVVATNGPERMAAIFLHVLQYGRLPWYAPAQWYKQEAAWLDSLPDQLTQPANRSKFRQLLQREPAALNRLLLQFPAAFNWQLLSGIYHQPLSTVKNPEAFIQDLITAELKTAGIPGVGHPDGKNLERHLLENLFRNWIHEKSPDLEMKEQISNLIQNTLTKPKGALTLPEPPIAENKLILPEEDKVGLFVQAAGLVLLHPFLEYFLRDFGLLQGDNFVDDQARQLAVHLLHYLATGQEQAPEPLLTFEKYLCGWDVTGPINREVIIPAGMKAEANHLLQAVIRHWKALRNTSPDGLREGFLIRPGKLIIHEQPHQLLVENNSTDVLLSYLPWSFSIIHLPWQSTPLYTTWSS